MFERARWEAFLQEVGLDVFERAGVWPTVRKSSFEYYARAVPGDVLKFETTLTQLGKTSFTLHQVARRPADRAMIAEADFVLVCVNRAGEASDVPDAIKRALGTRPSIRVGAVHHLVVGDNPTPVDVQGDGAAILFIHGFPLDRTMWRRVMAPMTGWRRVAPDLRGFGMNGAQLEQPSIESYADDMVALMDQLSPDPVVVCGLSMGGYIALDIIRRFPDRVAALILANTRAEADGPEAQAARDRTIAMVEQEGLDALATAMLPKILGETSRTTQHPLVEHVRTMITSSSTAGVVAALMAMKLRPDATATLSKIAVPTLVITGAEDTLIPPQVAKKLAEAIPGAHYTVIPAAGHLTPAEQPIATGRVIGEFLDAVS